MRVKGRLLLNLGAGLRILGTRCSRLGTGIGVNLPAKLSVVVKPRALPPGGRELRGQHPQAALCHGCGKGVT